MNHLIKKLDLELIDNYQYLEDLKGGKAATLCKYIERGTNNTILFKFLIAPRRDEERNAFEAEAESLSLLTKLISDDDDLHTFPKLIYPFTKKEDEGIYYFGFEFIEGITLREYFNKKPLPWKWEDSLKIIYKVVIALSSISIFQIVHSDLHPGNILLKTGFDLKKGYDDNNNSVAILDLGCSKNYLEQLFHSEKINLNYFRHFGAMSSWSPEFLQNPKSATVNSDIWAIGVLFFYLITNEFPIESKNFGEFYKNCVIDFKLNLDPIEKLNLPYLTEQLLLGMLKYNPDERLLHHPITNIISDILDGKILTQSPEFQKEYISKKGDIWQCPQCGYIGQPNGNRCIECGRFNNPEDWLKPF